MKFSLRFLMSASAGLAALAVMSPVASAKTVDHEISGHARTRMVFEDNDLAGFASDTDATERWENRVRLNMDVMPATGLKVRISPQFTHYFGVNTTTGAAGEPKFTAKEAWMMYSPNNMVTLHVGRQQFAYGNELVFGTNGWFLDTNHHDGVRATFEFDAGHADVFYLKNTEASSTSGRDSDTFGFYSTFDKMGMMKVVDFYGVWVDQRSAAALTRARFGTFGIRTAADFNAIDMDAEITTNFGKVAGQDIKGISGDLQLGYNWMDHRVGLGVVYANSEYLEIAPTTHRNSLRAHRYMGDANAFSRNNIVALSLVSNWALSKEFEASVDGYYFMAAKDDHGITGGVESAAKRAAGMEADLAIAYTPMEMISFQTGYALFKPAGGVDDAGSDKTLHRAYLQGMVRF